MYYIEKMNLFEKFSNETEFHKKSIPGRSWASSSGKRPKRRCWKETRVWAVWPETFSKNDQNDFKITQYGVLLEKIPKNIYINQDLTKYGMKIKSKSK
jgi:hypothetical protein